MMKTSDRKKLSLVAVALALGLTSPTSSYAQQDTAWTTDIVYTGDVTGVLKGRSQQAGRFLDNLDVIIEGDLGKLMGWSGAKVHAYFLNNTGGEPNSIVGTLQGIDNIEVSRPHARLYELWVEQSFASDQAALLFGLYDLNSDFYATETSDLLIAPPFGIGSELAATGRNGPSIFPSTALAIRARVGRSDSLHVKAAVMNAIAGTWGDLDGVDNSFDDGALMIVEGGWGGPNRFVLGAWNYSKRQSDIREITDLGSPVQREAQGIYALAEVPLLENSNGSSVGAFLRGGISDGDTTDFEAGWQAGLLVNHALRSRPNSAISIGVHQGVLSSGGKANIREAGWDPSDAETGFEVTYSDTVGPVRVQPDLQWIRSPGGRRDARDAVVATVRLTFELK